MIKVLNIISDTNIGGAGRVILNYLKYRDQDRFAISVALPRDSQLTEKLREFDIPIYEIDGIADRSLDWQAVGKLKKVIATVAPDIVHTHGSMAGRIAAKQCRTKIIYTRHSAFPPSPRTKKGIGRFLYKTINEHYADRIIAVSPAAKENLTDGGISEDLIEVMMNGVDPIVRADAEACTAMRAKYGIPDHFFTAGILARVEDYKGHLDILAAAKLLKDQGDDVLILMAGTGTFEATVKQKIDELDLGDSVLFLGFIDDVPTLLSLLDVQLNASYGTETSSLSLLEGYSIGIPAIASDYGGNPQLLKDGYNGLMFPTRDSRTLARHIKYLKDHAEERRRMGENALKLYREKFTGEIFARNIEAVYIKTLGGVQDDN